MSKRIHSEKDLLGPVARVYNDLQRLATKHGLMVHEFSTTDFGNGKLGTVQVWMRKRRGAKP